MYNIIAIDPGPTQSAFYMALGGTPICAIEENSNVANMLSELYEHEDTTLAIEMVASYGMPVGKDVFMTCVWIGRFLEAWGGRYEFIYRKDVKMHLCNSMRAKDSNIRQALIDKFGPGKDKAIGKKKTPGPLYGYKSDMWAALAVAVTYHETKQEA